VSYELGDTFGVASTKGIGIVGSDDHMHIRRRQIRWRTQLRRLPFDFEINQNT